MAGLLFSTPAIHPSGRNLRNSVGLPCFCQDFLPKSLEVLEKASPVLLSRTLASSPCRHVDSQTAGAKMKTGQPPVLVSLVTHNEELFLARCLGSLKDQTVEVRVKIFDNASQDATRDIARSFEVELYESGKNCGYSLGHNHNLSKPNFETALLLNADVVLCSDYVEVLLAVLDECEGAGIEYRTLPVPPRPSFEAASRQPPAVPFPVLFGKEQGRPDWLRLRSIPDPGELEAIPAAHQKKAHLRARFSSRERV